MTTGPQITLAHGGGGTMMQDFLHDVVLPRLHNPALDDLADAAVLACPHGGELAFTTDSFVVQPLFFPGGDIGHLAVCGTVNDLAVMGAKPAALSLACILESGVPMDVVARVMDSVKASAADAGVPVVTGDTKVVEKGQADQIYLTTSGVGWRMPHAPAGWRSVQKGDAVMVSGSIGHHGVAVLAARAALPFTTPLSSDCAPLNGIVGLLLEAEREVRWMRDPTRGGLAAALNELAVQAGVGIELDAAAVPLADDVKGAAEMLGLDPLYLANEGRFVVVCPASRADKAIAVLRSHPLGRGAARIGTVTGPMPRGRVVMNTGFGGTRIVDMPSGEQLPRIC